jgi:rubredoxin
MSGIHDARCPDCGTTLEPGFIGYFSGIVWSENELVGWRRLIPFVFGSAHFIIGNLGSTPWIRSREARKCRDCGMLVVPTTRH